MNDTLAAGFGRRFAQAMFETLPDSADGLGELDRQAGDGDFGVNITAALRRAQRGVDAEEPADYAGWLTAVSRGFLGTGGTSGPLFGMFFRELARCASGSEPSLAEFSGGLTAGVATVQRYGKAEIGHKTMIDALAPAAEELARLVAGHAKPGDALNRTAETAVAGARGTADLIAGRGRASYVGELARGVLDPGAVAAAIVLQAAAAAQQGADSVDTSWVTT